MNNYLKDLSLFGKAFSKTKHEMTISLLVLVVLTFVLSMIFYFAERVAQPDVFASYSDAIVWGYTRYIEGGDGVFDGAPVTVVGKVIATLLGFVGIAIVAIPAGLVGTGFIDAINEEKRDKELAVFHKKMHRAFPAGCGRQMRQYVGNLPKDSDAWYAGCQFGYVDSNVSISKFELKGMDLKDILEVCKKYPEFRVKNQAAAISLEDGKRDRYLLEYYPVNRRYGYFANRGSKVTIVSASSQTELGTGNFAYYLAKYGGFNFISKDFGAADGESFFNNHWAEPKYDGITLEERLAKGEKVSKEVKKKYKDKKALRGEFLNDLESLCREEGSWVICMLSHTKSQENVVDVHVASTLADGTGSTIISDKEKYDELLATLKKNMFDELQLSLEETTKYPHINRGGFRNILYKLHEDGCKCNGMAMRVSAGLMEFDVKTYVADFIMAKTIHDVIEPEHRLLPEEVEDMNRTSSSYGFMDQRIDEVKHTMYESE